MGRDVVICALVLGAGVLGGGCSGSDADSASVICEQSDRSGTYFMSFQEVSGTCGPQDSAVGRLSTEVPGECELLSPDIWSNNECTFERHIRCPFNEFAAGATLETTAISTQQDSRGEVITGTMTMILRDASGQSVCHGTYRVRAERQ
jgi:hypothetical protein